MRKLIFTFLCLCLAIGVNAQQKQGGLQSYIDGIVKRHSRASEPTVIDLANFNTNLTQPLRVYGGLNIRFENGILTTAEGTYCTLIQITENSTVELSESATFRTQKSDVTQYTHDPFVYLESGTLKISGGKIENYDKYTPVDRMVVTDGVNHSTNFEITAGKVESNIYTSGKGDNYLISGGEVNCIVASPYSNVIISETAMLGKYDQQINGSANPLKIASPLKNKIDFAMHGMSETECLFAVGYNGYTLTEDDLKYMNYVPESSSDTNDYEWYLNDGYAMLRAKGGLRTAADLQSKLDELYEQGYTSSDKVGLIEIPVEGILIDQPLIVRCYVTITGGPLKVMDDYDAKLGADFVFCIQKGGRLNLRDITFDANDQYHHFCTFLVFGDLWLTKWFKAINISRSRDYTYGFIYADGGNIEIANGGTFDMVNNLVYCPGDESHININGESKVIYAEADCPGKIVVGKQARVNLYHTSLSYDGEGPAFDVAYLHISDEAFLKCAGVAIKADWTDYEVGSVTAETTYCTGNIFITDFALSKYMIFRGTSYMGGRDKTLPDAFFEKDAYVEINMALTQSWNLVGGWENFTDGTPFIKGGTRYAISDNDMSFLNFKNLPEGYEAYLDKGNNCIRLRLKQAPVKDSDSLQDFLDKLAQGERGTEEDPVEIPVDGDVDIDKDVTFNDLQALIDGLANKGDGDGGTGGLASHTFKFTGGNMNIGPSSCVTITNLYIDGCTGSHHIYVDGTLIIDVNVYIRHFVDVAIHVRKGGKVIWRGSSEDCSEVIRNEGGEVYIYKDDTDSGSGGSHATNYFIHNISGKVYIHGGIYWSDKSVIYNQTGGSVYIYDGEFHGGIINHGYLWFEGGNSHGGSNPGVTNYGEFYMPGGTATSDGDRSIVTYVNIHICGCANVKNIYISRGAMIYITARLTTIFRIHFIDENGFELMTPIVIGDKDYTLTPEDFKLFEFILPDGFEAKYDESLKAIIIQDMSGINDIKADADATPKAVYNLSGVKVGDTTNLKSLAPGVYIINGEKVAVN